MQVASRPRLNAGIAVVGASVIAVCPLAPQMPDVHLPSIQSAAVELAASMSAMASAPVANPIEQWTQVVQAAVANLGAIGQTLAKSPDPILQQIQANQSADAAILNKAGTAASTALTTAAQALPAAFQAAATQLEAGDVTGAVTTLTGPVLPLALGLIDAGFTGANAWQVAVTETQNLANVVAIVPKLVLPALLAVASPLISDINASAAIGQAVVDAGKVGDLEGVVTALVNAPATLTGATLNGYGTLPLLGTPVGGLLSGPGSIPGLTDGTIAGLLALRDQIAAALDPTTKKAAADFASPAALPAAGATTLALTTAPDTKAIAAPATNVSKLAGLPKLHVPVTAPRTVPAGTTASGAAVTDATATATGSTAVPVNSGSTSGKPANANNPVKAAISNVSAGITKAVSGGTGKSTASAGSSGGTGKSSASAGSSKGSGGGGRHRK
jgi:hypothetical protein